MIYCKQCSRLLEQEADECPYCGEKDDTSLSNEIDEQMNELDAIISQKKEENANSQVIVEDGPTPPVSIAKPPENTITGGTRVLFILLSIFIAPVGIIIGALYMAKDQVEYRALGKTMLILALVSAILAIICCCGIYIVSLNLFLNPVSF